MHPFRHQYRAAASASPGGPVRISAARLTTLTSEPPVEFGGPGDQWSPETLLCGALADCLTLTFRAVAAASRLEYSSVEVRVQGTLDKQDGVAQFTHFDVDVELRLPPGADAARARALVEKAKGLCLVANSLKADRALSVTVTQD